ncbi:MAG: DUF996 domain-containing protein [Thermoprotei archaeon]|nr:DUF996 domain-containing protein [Thermoprotei archaeon]
MSSESPNFTSAKTLGLLGGAMIAVVGVFKFVVSVGTPYAFVGPTVFYLGMLYPEYVDSAMLYPLTIIAIIGWILLFYSLFRFSEIYGEERIRKYASYSIILGIGLPFLGMLVLIPLLITSEDILKVFLMVLPLFLAGALLMGYFIYRSLSLLADKSNEPLLKKGGIIMFIAVPTTIIHVGCLLETAGGIAIALAFDKMRPPSSVSPHPRDVQSTNKL